LESLSTARHESTLGFQHGRRCIYRLLGFAEGLLERVEYRAQWAALFAEDGQQRR